MIKLIDDNSILDSEFKALAEWIATSPRITKGNLTNKLESKFANYIGTNYSVFVNSGSSANLIAIYSLLFNENLKNMKVVVPAVCWATTIAPLMQFGFQSILCDVNLNDLSIDLDHFETIVKQESPAALVLVHPLGFMADMDRLMSICNDNQILVIEDSCETLGTKYQNKKSGNFGLMSTFSTYYSHHITTGEGGFICTNDEQQYSLLKMLRAHGWDRDISPDLQKKIRLENNIDEFNALFTFYIPGFNVRATDIQAFLGLKQLERVGSITEKRQDNYFLYDSLIVDHEFKVRPNSKLNVISNFAYPIIHKKRKEIIDALTENDIECRPLICGNIAKQPFVKMFMEEVAPLSNADLVHEYGLYLPNHTSLEKNQIEKICNIVNCIILGEL